MTIWAAARRQSLDFMGYMRRDRFAPRLFLPERNPRGVIRTLPGTKHPTGQIRPGMKPIDLSHLADFPIPRPYHVFSSLSVSFGRLENKFDDAAELFRHSTQEFGRRRAASPCVRRDRRHAFFLRVRRHMAGRFFQNGESVDIRPQGCYLPLPVFCRAAVLLLPSER